MKLDTIIRRIGEGTPVPRVAVEQGLGKVRDSGKRLILETYLTSLDEAPAPAPVTPEPEAEVGPTPEQRQAARELADETIARLAETTGRGFMTTKLSRSHAGESKNNWTAAYNQALEAVA